MVGQGSGTGGRQAGCLIRRESRVKISAPMSSDRSDTNTLLGLEYPHMDVSNDTNMTAMRALMVLLLPPPPKFNIGLSHAS